MIATFARKWDTDVPAIILTGEVSAVNPEQLGNKIELLKKPASARDIMESIHRLCFRSSSDLEVSE